MGDKTPSGWLPATLIYNIIPAFTERTVTNLLYHGITTALGLHFPLFIASNPYLYFTLAPFITGLGHLATSVIYQTALNASMNNPQAEA